jgi:hypothetical protein
MHYGALFNLIMHDKAFRAILETILPAMFDPDQLQAYLSAS